MDYKQIQIVSMAEAKKKKSKRKKIRYYKVEFKISKQEKEKIERFSAVNKVVRVRDVLNPPENPA